MQSMTLRRAVALATAGVLILAMSSVVPAAAARPAQSAHFVMGSYTAAYSANADLTAIQRYEITTDALGRVVFGYYEHTTLTSGDWASKATVESVRFFTATSGAAAAEFVGMECTVAGTGAPYGECGRYHIIVSDGAPVGQPDTFCGGPATDPDPANWPCFSWNLTSGNIAIY